MLIEHLIFLLFCFLSIVFNENILGEDVHQSHQLN